MSRTSTLRILARPSHAGPFRIARHVSNTRAALRTRLRNPPHARSTTAKTSHGSTAKFFVHRRRSLVFATHRFAHPTRSFAHRAVASAQHTIPQGVIVALDLDLLARWELIARSLAAFAYAAAGTKPHALVHRTDRKSTRLNSSHSGESRMPSSA